MATFLTRIHQPPIGPDMKALIKTVAAAAAIAAAIIPSQAQEAHQLAASSCLAPDNSRSDRMDWFLGLHPSDDLLSAWCRLQAVPGAVRFNILFPVTGVHRSWDTTFDGDLLPASRIVELVQSLLPTTDGPAKDENGMEFPKVLRNVVQLAGDKAPDGTALDFAEKHPAARELVLWEPIVLRIKPVALAGQEFTMFVTLRPDLGMLALGLQGKATDVRLQGWKGRMPFGGFFGNSCSSSIPLCQDFGDTVTFHAPWVLHEVRLQATGENMTAAAGAIMNQLSSRRSSFLKEGNPPQFDVTTGTGRMSLSDGLSTMTMEADGSPGGTKSIMVTWKESGLENGIAKQLEKAARLYRTGASAGPRTPGVPDSLGAL